MEAAVLATFDRGLTARTGERLRLRPIRPDGAPRLLALYERLSRDTRYQRFFSVMRLPTDWARFLATVDHVERFAIVIERPVGSDVELIGVARYEPSDAPGDFDLAFVVEDGWQGQGLGALLVQELIRTAVANGFARFRAYVLAENRRMLALLATFTDVKERKLERGVISLLATPKP